MTNKTYLIGNREGPRRSKIITDPAEIEKINRRLMEEGDGGGDGNGASENEKPVNEPFQSGNTNIVSHDYIQIPGTNRIISRFEVQGYNNLNWGNMQFKLHENGLYMPTVPEFMQHFQNVVASYNSKGKKPLFDANGNPISEEDIEDIYLHLTKNHIATYGAGTSEGAWTYLDAKFLGGNGNKGMKMFSQHRTKIDSQGNKTLVPSKSEDLESCLNEDRYAELKFNSQGFPIQESKKQEYEQGNNFRFWYPRNEGVARFGAGSGGASLDCNWFPGYANSSLGVFAVAQGG